MDEPRVVADDAGSQKAPRRLRRTLGIGAMAVSCAVAGAVAGAMTFPSSHVGQAYGADTAVGTHGLATAASATCKTFAPPAGLPALPGGGAGSVGASGAGGSVSASGDTNKGVTLCAQAPSFPAGGGSGAMCQTFSPPAGIPAGSLPGAGSVSVAGGGGSISVSGSSKGATVCATPPSLPSGSGSGATCKSFSAPSSLPSLPGNGSGTVSASGGGGSISASGSSKGGTVCVKPPSAPSVPSVPAGSSTGVPAKGQGSKPHKSSKQTCTSTPGIPAGVSLPGTASGGLSLTGGGTSISVKASKDGLTICHGPVPSLPKPPSLPKLPGVPPVPASGGGSVPLLGDLPIPGL